jgi:hypothetical protein
MSRYSTSIDRNRNRSLAIVLFVLWTLLSVPAFCDNFCDDAVALSLNEKQKIDRDSSETPHIFTVDVPTAGILTFDAAVPGPAPAELRLDWLDGDCRGGETTTASSLIERSVDGLVLWVRNPGVYSFRVAAQDISLPLEGFSVRVSFLGSPAAPTKDGDEDEPLEIDPDGLRISSPLGRSALCPTDELDDHGDTRRCASFVPLGVRISGELSPTDLDDEDFFQFVLLANQTVRIESQGSLDTFGGLYDDKGHRLAATDGGGQEGNFRIVKTLAPGRYFVRVESPDRSQGFYDLTIAAVSW